MIEFDRVGKVFPRLIGERDAHRALDGVSFRVAPGEAVGMIGVNGAGKSTCIRLLMDFIRPTEGRIRLFGGQPDQAILRRRVGYLPEVASFPKNLTCMEMLRFSGMANGLDEAQIRQAAEFWLRKLKLWEHRHRLLRGFSKGMQQRAGFATALIHNPELLVLDEPMSGLDPLGRAEIVSLILELKQSGKSILFCSHLLDDVERLTDRLIVLHRGKVLFDGPAFEMCGPTGGWRIRLRDGTAFTVPHEQDLRQLLETQADAVLHIQGNTETLEEAFVRLVEKANARGNES